MELVKGSKALAKSNEDIEEVFNSIVSIIIGFTPEEATKLVQTFGEVTLSADFSGTGWQSNVSKF